MHYRNLEIVNQGFGAETQISGSGSRSRHRF